MSRDGDLIRKGTTVRVQFKVRAIYPDGRVVDSSVHEGQVQPAGSAGRVIADAFGRTAFPEGTRFERYERRVTTIASEWELQP